MDIYMKIKLTIGLLYFLQTLTYVQGEYTYTYVGCYVDMKERALSEEDYKNEQQNTIEKCIDFCGEKSYKYAGLQFSKQCFCGNSEYNKYGEGDGCDAQCTGNHDQICGGTWHNSVYSINEVVETTTTTPTATAMTATTMAVTTTTTTTAHRATSSATTYPKDTTINTSNTLTNTESITSANNQDQRSTGKYIGIGVGVIAAGAIIVLVVVLVVRRRRQHSGEDSNVSCQKTSNNSKMAGSNMYVNASSADLSPKPKSTPGDDNLYAHYSVIDEHGYTVPEPETSSSNNQSAVDNCEDVQVYILAEPIIDDLVVEDNPLYQ